MLFRSVLPKIRIHFEVHEDEDGNKLLTEKGEPMSISKDYTKSLGENSRLRADLKSWRGRDFTQEEINRFSWTDILDKWAYITVVRNPGSNGIEYSNIDACPSESTNRSRFGQIGSAGSNRSTSCQIM